MKTGAEIGYEPVNPISVFAVELKKRLKSG
jgi:hypothetical protein